MKLEALRENPHGKMLRLGLEPFGASPGAFAIIRTGPGPEAFVAYMRNVKEDPARNGPACRKAFEALRAEGYARIFTSTFDGSPLEAIFAELCPRRVSLTENFHAALPAGAPPAPPLRLEEAECRDPRVLEVFERYAALGRDGLVSAAPALVHAIWSFDAYASRRRPLLALDEAGRPLGAAFDWDEPSHYSPATALAFFCWTPELERRGLVAELVGASRARAQALGRTHLLCCADAENAPLKAAFAAHGFLPNEGAAARFLCREYARA